MIIDSAFTTAMHATRCVSNTALGGYSPGALVFNRDMFLDIPLIADILTLQKYDKQKLISIYSVPMPNASHINSNYMIKSTYTMLTLHLIN